jgi:hypothetical protein
MGELDYPIMISYIFFKNLTKALNRIFSIPRCHGAQNKKCLYDGGNFRRRISSISGW